MKFAKKDHHRIDVLFPLSLFFVFAASSLAVLLLAANLYRSQVATEDRQSAAFASLAYVSEKIRQNDAGGGISVKNLEDVPCLALESRSNDTDYTTYIYAYEGMLKELFIRSDAQARLADGRDLMELKEFTIEEIEKHLFRFTSVGDDGTTDTLIASERSAP